MVQDVRVKKPDLTWVSIVGPQGPTGVSTIIVGSFGPGTGTPATLPPDGALVADFVAPGSAAYQMNQGESLYYEAPTGAADPLDGHLFQYVTTAMNPAGWIDVGLIQGPVGPEGPIGPVGPERDEVFIGPDAPDPVLLPYSDIWYDDDAPEPPPRGMDDVVMKAGIHSHHIYGPLTSAGAVWTWTLKAGDYLCLFTMSCVATANGIRYVNLNMDGTQVAQSKMYFNTTSSHQFMNMGVSVITIPVDGDYAFDLTMSASATIDGNDFGQMTLIPAALGTVH